MIIYLSGGWSGAESGSTAGSPRQLRDAMKVYLVGGGETKSSNASVEAISKGRPMNTLRLLLSYHYYKDEDITSLLAECFDKLPVKLDVFADSGAYSAWSVGGSIDPRNYTAWVKRFAKHFTAVAGPDVIGDPKETYIATKRMVEALPGVSILPTFHVGEDWEWLTKHIALGTGYVAFGGMVPYTRQRALLAGWCTKAFKLVPEHVKVHGFGMTTWPLMLAYPWHSVDSSSWASVFRFAQLQLFDPARGHFVEVKMGNKPNILSHTRILAEYGLRARDVLFDSYDRNLVCVASVESWQRAEAWISNRKANRIYLSCGANPAGPNARGGAGDVRTVSSSMKKQRGLQ